MSSVVTRFARGVWLPFRAARLAVTQPRLLAACLIPWAIAAALSWFLIQQASAWALALLGWGAGMLGLTLSGVLATLLQGVLVFLSWAAGALFLVWVAALVAIPFADWLSELTEPHAEPPLERPMVEAGWFTRVQWRRIRMDLYKTLVSLVVSVLGFLLSSIPVIGLIGPVVLALGLTYQFLGYPQTRRDEGVVASLGFIVRRLPACLGFGLVLMAGFAIPLFSAFLFPVAVIGGTLLYAAER